jgi:hypothetical protein
MHDFFLRNFTKSRAQPSRGPDVPVPFQSTRQYDESTNFFLKKVLAGAYCMGQRISHNLKIIYQQVLKPVANEASAQGLQNAL